MSLVMDDQQILKEISMRNRHVFDGLYDIHYKRLFMVAYQYLRNHEMAEEVVHDVFIKIWNNSGKILLSSSLTGYLSRSVINTSLNTIKQQRSKGTTIELSEYGDIIIESDQEDAESLESKLLALESAVEALPSQCRRVLEMSKFEKLKQQEISDRLGISIKTVKNHLTYGYKKIRENFSQSMLILFIFILMYRSFLS